MNPYIRNAIFGAVGASLALALLVFIVSSTKWAADTFGGWGLFGAFVFWFAAGGALVGALSTTPPK